MSEKEVLWQPFDIERHKSVFKHYLEVIIDEDGRVMYAVPSHQEKALNFAVEKTGKSRAEIINSCPPAYYFDYLNWLLSITGAIAVWNDFVAAPAATRDQVATLRRLKMAGLYHGAIPKISRKVGEKK